jgi:TP53 regulating kinase-like protein
MKKFIYMEQGELLAQCAESKVFACNFYGKQAIWKHRFVKEYRHPVLDLKLREQRTVREARALVRCRKFGVPAPVVYSVDRNTCTIVMERIIGISARDLIHGCPDGSTRAVVAKRVLETIGEIVGLLHQGDMIHGDLTTSNFIVVGDILDDRSKQGAFPTAVADEPVTRNGLVVIDFGLVSDKNSAEERAVDLYVLERAVSSAHPLVENVAESILAGYARCIDSAKGKQTMDRLLAVRARGRKRSMIG